MSNILSGNATDRSRKGLSRIRLISRLLQPELNEYGRPHLGSQLTKDYSRCVPIYPKLEEKYFLQGF